MSISWKKTIFIILIIFTALKIQSPRVLALESRRLFSSFAASSLKSRVLKPLLVAQNSSGCEQLNSQYQQVYAFETQSFYISICQTKDNYFYYRQSKLNPQDTLLLPAEIVFGGDVYQAVNGKTVYFVGMDDSGYYSSVMYNNNEIVFEPELKQPSTRLAGRDNSSPSTSNQGISKPSFNRVNSDRLKLGLERERSDRQARNCTQDRTNLALDFNDWQEFINQSPTIVGEYAANNGHDFTYNEETFKQAFIATKDGLAVNLDIAPLSKTVRRVCVDSIISTEWE